MFASKTISGFEMHFRPGSIDEILFTNSFDNDVFLREMDHYRPEPGHIVVEIGAHIGTFCVPVASRTAPGAYHAIEACEENFSLLDRNVRANKLHNVTTHRLAISGSSGMARLYHDSKSGSWGHSVVSEVGEEYEEVESMTLPEFFRRNEISRCDLLKMNCEGAEFPIIASLDEASFGLIRNLTLEFHSHLWKQAGKEDLENALKAHGFEVNLRHFDGLNGWLVAHRA